MRLKIKAFLCVTMILAGQFMDPAAQHKESCLAPAVDRGTMPSYAVASKISYLGMQSCMSASLDATPLNRLLPSFLLAEVWPLGQAIEASIAITRQANTDPALKNFAESRLGLELRGLRLYWDPRSTPPGYYSTIATKFDAPGAKYYDDNAWLGLVMVELYKIYGQKWMLDRAVEIVDFDMYGAVGSTTYAKPGGVFWTQAPGNFYRASVSTAGSVQLALELYRVTNNSTYLNFAIAAYDWVSKYLKGPEGLYHDGLNEDGSISPVYYSYNQGLMVADGALLFEVTGKHQYLSDAEVLAAAALDYFAAGTRLIDEDPIFMAIFFRNLMLLDALGGHSNYRPLMELYAHDLWTNLNSMGMLIHKGTASWLSQAAVVQVFADLSRPAADFLPLCFAANP
jgi:hypothetical protein